MSRPPILQVITSTKRRGAEVHAVDLDGALRARGRDVRTMALAPATDGLEQLDVESLGTRSLGLATLRHLRRAIPKDGLLVSHGSRTLPACFVATIGIGQRFVYRSIGDAQHYASSTARRSRVQLYLRRAEAVVALWPTAADRLVQNFGVPAERITVIPTGVPAARFPAVDNDRRAAARERLGLDRDEPVVLYLGWLIPEKGAHLAIEAMAFAPDVTLVIAGDGPERAALEAFGSKTAPGRVRFLGSVQDPSDVLAACDALVMPSLSEGLPAVLVEAGLTGLPAVASDIGAVREVVLDGETGVVVPAGDASAMARGVRTALEAGAEFGAKARAHCLRRFEIGVVAEQWDGVFDGLRPRARSER